MNKSKTNMNSFIKHRMPPRSMFYHIEPIGIRTPYVESLTGYITRLAQAHNISIDNLFKHEIRPRYHNRYHDGPMDGFMMYGSETNINIDNNSSKKIVGVLIEMTKHPDIRSLIFSGWNDKISRYNLMTTDRRWCPECYDEMAAYGKEVYEPLIWSFRALDYCEYHKIILHQKCPLCRRKPKLIEKYTRPGYCSNCGGWLGTNKGKNRSKYPKKDEMIWQLWVLKNLKLLLSTMTIAEKSKSNHFYDNLSYLQEKYFSQNLVEMADITQTHPTSLRGYLNLTKTPSLQTLLKIGFSFDISVFELLCCSIQDRYIQIQKLPPLDTLKIQTPKKVFKYKSVKKKLEKALMEDPPPSMNSISERLGIQRAYLKKKFPTLFQFIVNRHSAYRQKCHAEALEQKRLLVLNAIDELCNRGIFPSQNQIVKLTKNHSLFHHNEIRKIYFEAINRPSITSPDID